MKTSYIAVIAVVVVAIVGVGVYFAFFNNGGGNDALDVDVVKNTVVVGDYVEYEAIASGKSSSEGEIDDEEFIATVFSLPDGVTVVGTESITYKGQTIVCEKYSYELFGSALYWAKDGAVYKAETTLGEMKIVSALVDTSLDLTTPEQEIGKDSFIKISMTVSANVMMVKIDLISTTTTTITGFDSASELYKTKVDVDITGSGDTKLTVTAVSGDEITIDGADEPITKEQFYSLLDIEKYKEYIKKQGTVVEGQKIDKGTVKTCTGDRKVTEQQFKITSDEQSQSINVRYGDKGAIYSFETIQENMTATLTLKGTSMYEKA